MPIQGLKISLAIGLIWLALFITGFILLGLFLLIVTIANWYCKMRYLTTNKKLDNI